MSDDEFLELDTLLMDAARLPAIVRERDQAVATLEAAKRAYTETKGSPGVKARAACREQGLTPPNGRRGPTFNKSAVLRDYELLISERTEKGELRTPREAISELREMHSFQSDDSCLQYLRQLRKELREFVNLRPADPFSPAARMYLDWLSSLPGRGGS